MRKKDRIRSRRNQQLADYYLAKAAVSKTKVTTISASKTKVTTISAPRYNSEAKMRQESDSLKDYYSATAISITKVEKCSPNNNNNFETKDEKMVAVVEAAAAPAPPTISFTQEILSFWCTAFGDVETESTSYGFCSSNNTICSCGTKDDNSNSSHNRNPDDRNPTTKKKSSSDFGRRDDFRDPYTMTSPPKMTEDANSLLTGNESDKITSHPTSPPRSSNDDVNMRRNREKQNIRSTLALADETVDLNSRDDCNSTIQSNGASTILTFDEANHCHRHQKSPRFINCCSVSDALPGLPFVEEEEEEERGGGGGKKNASTDPTASHESFDDALSTAVLKPVVDYDRYHVTASGVNNVHNGGDAKPIEGKQSESTIKSRHSAVGSLTLDKLRKYLPYDFQLTYSLTMHGSDLQTVLEKTKSCIYTTLLVVETTDGEAFGVFTAKPWSVTRKFHSGPESFLWRLGSTTGDDVDDFELYPFAGKSADSHFCNMDRVVAAVNMVSHQGGAGYASSSKSSQLEMTEWGFGLSFQWDLRLGTSTASKKFNSPSLSENHRFVVKNIEFYTIAP